MGNIAPGHVAPTGVAVLVEALYALPVSVTPCQGFRLHPRPRWPPDRQASVVAVDADLLAGRAVGSEIV